MIKEAEMTKDEIEIAKNLVALQEWMEAGSPNPGPSLRGYYQRMHDGGYLTPKLGSTRKGLDLIARARKAGAL